MTTLIAFLIVCLIGILGIEIVRYNSSGYFNLQKVGIFIGIAIVAGGIVIGTDYRMQTSDNEIRSGKIVSVNHKEEWKQWVPPKYSKGKLVRAGHWIHHDAENYVETTDGGSLYVTRTPDGERRFTDSFVNNDKELQAYYPIGSYTASVHTYTNKLKPSYSVFKYEEKDLKEFEGLPDYPLIEESDLTITRLFGNFPNKQKLSKHLNKVNTTLTDTDNPNNIDKTKGYKQVNLMFANFGNKPIDYGYALQDHWKNGAKNDFVVTFGTDSKGKISWCHTFSWTEVEILKTDVREYMIGKNINNFRPVIYEVGELVEQKFDRKEFADFNYIQVSIGVFGKIGLGILAICLVGGYVYIKD